MPTRPRYEPSSSSSSSSVMIIERPDRLRVYIIPAKLPDSAVVSLSDLVNDSADFALCREPQHADILITVVRMKARLERYLSWDIAKQKKILLPHWLEDCVHNRKVLPTNLEQYIAIPTTVSPPPVPTIPSPRPTPIKPCYKNRLSCQRRTPLKCPNEDLVSQLSVLHRQRELEGLDMNALGYERAIAALRAFPVNINERNVRDIGKLPFVGAKIKWKISEFVDRGDVSERNEIMASERFKVLSLFTTVHGIGPKSARLLYSLGLRTLDDLEQYYSSFPSARRRGGGSLTVIPTLSTLAYLELYSSLTKPIPRSEVSQVHDTITEHLDAILPGCWSTITGGYRRGKPLSGDVDIVITHPEQDVQRIRLGETLVKRLFDAGLVTHLAVATAFSSQNLLTIFRLPNGTHRRVDLIITPVKTYWCAIVGWTGSKTFERDLRLYAKEKGMKFDSYGGITRLRDSKVFYPKSENEIFEILDLEWIEPTMRNA